MPKWIRNWFSNFETLEEPIILYGVKCWTVEAFFQAMKVPKQNVELRKRVLQMKPAEAKHFCSRRANNFQIRKDWLEIRLEVMEFALRKKFAKGKWLKQLLSTGEELIEETNDWHDNFWGNCICDRCKNIPGQNYLGRLLQKIRSES